ncbi:MAG TPA: hypothetical protein VIT65_03050 [Microlunatus sp.]
MEDVRADLLHDGLCRQRLADVTAGDGAAGGLHPQAQNGVRSHPEQQTHGSGLCQQVATAARSTLIGFSVHTFLPAAIAFDATSACTAGMVKVDHHLHVWVAQHIVGGPPLSYPVLFYGNAMAESQIGA